MGKLAWLVGGTAGGAFGWWAGERFGVMTAFILSTVGTAIGIYVTRRWLAQYQ